MIKRRLPWIAGLLSIVLFVACAPDKGKEAAAPSPTSAGQANASQSISPALPPVMEEENTWDLTEYFADDTAFDEELQKIREVELPQYKEQALAVKDADSLLSIQQYSDVLSRRLSHLQCYAAQKSSLNAGDSTAQSQQNAVTLLAQDFSLIDTNLTNRLIGMGDAFWKPVFADERLKPYWRQLTKMREDAAYTLSDTEERLLLPAYQAQANIQNTFSMLNYANISFPTIQDPSGAEVVANYTNFSSAMANPSREYRKTFYEALTGTYGTYRDTFASNLNAYITLSEQLSRLHHYQSVLDAATQENGINAEIYDALIQAGKNGTEVLIREGNIRKKALGLDVLYSYDTRAPLGCAAAPSFSYEEAQVLIKSALSPLGQDYGDALEKAFSGRWIDVYPKDGKDTGAYSGMAVDIHPWLLLNYTGDYSSVSTLAHELGHAMHQYKSLSAQTSVYEQSPTSLVSEVASTCNEQLLSRYLIAHASSDEEKLYYVQQELNMLRNTFFSQISYGDFERRIHKLVEDGQTLTADTLDTLYLENLKTYSPAVTITDTTASYWAAVPHFYYNYYVYSYAMAISVSCVVSDAIAGGDEAMLQKYLAFLSAGNTTDAVDLFEGLGVDVTKPNYTEPLIRRYAQLLDMEEALLGM